MSASLASRLLASFGGGTSIIVPGHSWQVAGADDIEANLAATFAANEITVT